MDLTNLAVLKKLAGKGGGGVSSWNDLTDKPFGKTETLLFEGSEPTYDGSLWAIEAESNFSFVYGKQYKVILDGTEYVLSGDSQDGISFIGDIGIFMGAPTGVAPFLAMVGFPTEGMFLFGSTVQFSSLSIYAVDIQTLDDMYLPNNSIILGAAIDNDIRYIVDTETSLAVTMSGLQSLIESGRQIYIRVTEDVATSYVPIVGAMFGDSCAQVTVCPHGEIVVYYTAEYTGE